MRRVSVKTATMPNATEVGSDANRCFGAPLLSRHNLKCLNKIVAGEHPA